MVVRPCPPKTGAVVTQFVTQVDDHVPRAVRFSGERPRPCESTAVRLIRPDDLFGYLGVHDRPQVSTAVFSTALAAGLCIRRSLTFRSPCGESNPRSFARGAQADSTADRPASSD